jgi:putative ABC transport system ATP-binding protein
MSANNQSEMILEAKSIYSLYKGKEGAANVVALRGLNLKLKKGEVVSVVGPSGSGKSTLLRILGGLQEPSAGEVVYDNANLLKIPEKDRVEFRRSMVGYVFQEGNLIPTISARANVVQTLQFSGVGRNEAVKKATGLMRLLGIENRMRALPTHLSGGERQRVAIARALANDPAVLLMDEPTGNLDYQNTDNILEIISSLRDKLNTTCLIVTHAKHVAAFTDRSLELHDGRFIGQHGSEVDLSELSTDREIFIGNDGTLTLPPDMLTVVYKYGELWKLHVEEAPDGTPKIIAMPRSANALSRKTGEKGKCPVCGATVDLSEFHCKSCGISLKK